MKRINLNTLLLFSVLIFIYSCSNDIPQKNDNLIEKRNGLIYKQKSDTPFTGTIKDTARGKFFEYEVKHGKKNGRFKISYKNGRVEMVGNISNDKNEGEWKYYYENGQLESTGDFANDTANGKWTWFYSNGIKREEGFLDMGKRDGRWIEFDSSGKVILEKFFKNGLQVN